MLATEAGPDLAVALASERRGGQDLVINLTKSGSLIEVAGPGRAGSFDWRRA